jgi:hypothetical protein
MSLQMSFNLMNGKDNIPLHNEKYSSQHLTQQSLLSYHDSFHKRSLAIPSHITLQHGMNKKHSDSTGARVVGVT